MPIPAEFAHETAQPDPSTLVEGEGWPYYGGVGRTEWTAEPRGKVAKSNVPTEQNRVRANRL